MISETHNIDCMEFMRGIPDNYFDLACVISTYVLYLLYDKRFKTTTNR